MRITLALCVCSTLALQTQANAQHREIAAHEHGRGNLNIAVEDGRVSMELEVPAADIVGFEHAPKTARQKAAVDKAKKQLGAPQALIKLPAAARCVFAEATVAIEGGNPEPNKKDKKQSQAGEVDDHVHAEFRAQYTFTCAAPASVTFMEFGYFQAFPGAERLDVNLTTAKGQSKFEVTRAKPRIDLTGMM